jgi:hypothetical protein
MQPEREPKIQPDGVTDVRPAPRGGQTRLHGADAKAATLAIFGGMPWATISLAEMDADAEPTVELVLEAKTKPLTLKKTPCPEAATWLKEPADTASS